MAVKSRKHDSKAATSAAPNSNQSNSNAKIRSPRKGFVPGRAHEKSKQKNGKSYFKIALIAGLAVLIGYLKKSHITTLFESDRQFAYLSTLEREMSFRTEMGLYYSYYKSIVDAPTFLQGLHELTQDNVTEYPLTINTLKRFNLYPEVVLAGAFRIYESVSEFFNHQTKICYDVNRGNDMSPVKSCDGWGEPSMFYVDQVFLINGIMLSVFFLFGTYLSGSIIGGLITAICFFYNHGECTRVQWTPPLRESFAYPFFVIEMLLVTHIIKTRNVPSFVYSVILAIPIISFMLSWQFAQFALLTQTLSVFATYALQYIGSHKTLVILIGQFAAFVVSYVLLYGNEMLLTSFYASGLTTVLVIVLLEPVIEKLKNRLLILIAQGGVLVGGVLGLKILVSKLLNVTDDAHIGEILHSKFSDFKNFHSMMYTCAVEFNFLEIETPYKLSLTLLLPAVVLVIVVVTTTILKAEYQRWRYGTEPEIDESGDKEKVDTTKNTGKFRSKPYAEFVYHLFQFAAFTIMAVLIMRLKLFWTPHLCLLTSLVASKQLFGWVGSSKNHYIFLGVLLMAMSIQGGLNLKGQWSISGSYSNMQQEELIEWVIAKTPQDAVFGGPMPIMATIKLTTKRPIVNHPHYEDAGLRARTKKIYSMFSRVSVEEVWKNMRELQIQYLILEKAHCSGRSALGCTFAEIWDVEQPENKGREPACVLMMENDKPYFKRLFRNSHYDVLMILNVK